MSEHKKLLAQKNILYRFQTASITLKLCLTAALLLILVQCANDKKRGKYSAKELADMVISNKHSSAFSCRDSYCCSQSRECERVCNNIFYHSPNSVKKRCTNLNREIVFDLESVVKLLKNPLAEDLRYIDTREEFRLLLALDYHAWVWIIQHYQVSSAKQILIWLAEEKNLADELNKLTAEARNIILYELLASAGDKRKPGPVEEGLAQKISFTHTFLQHLVSNRNNKMLQMTHNMIRDDLCRFHNASSSNIELCILRIYCRERPQSNGDYVHSENLRNEIARRIEDDSLFRYVVDEIYLGGGVGVYIEPTLSNSVCEYACDTSSRGCE